MNQRLKLLAIPLISLAASCASSYHRDGYDYGSSESAQHRFAELRTLQDAQQVFSEQNRGSHQFDFKGHGRVTVREILLEGYPGNVYLKCRYHYQNRTDKAVVQSYVSLDALDKNGNLIASSTQRLIVPVPIAIARGAHIAHELRTQIPMQLLEPGWTWRIRCEAEKEMPEEPLDPPVEQRPPHNISSPVFIKNRGQNNR